MSIFEDKLLYEIDWRVSELSIITTLPHLYSFSDEQKIVFMKYSIPNIYSLWEGYVCESFAIYIRELNSLKLRRIQIHPHILAHAVDMEYKLKEAITDFKNQVIFVEQISGYLENDILLSINLPTQSNINHKVINNILHRFNLALLPDIPFKKQLNDLLFFRNKIAHGDYSVPVSQEKTDELRLSVIGLMHEIFLRISDGYKLQTYLR